MSSHPSSVQAATALVKRHQSVTCVRIAGPGRQPRLRRRSRCRGRKVAQLRCEVVLLLLLLLRLLQRYRLRALGLRRLLLLRQLLAQRHRLRLALLVLHLRNMRIPHHAPGQARLYA